VSFCLSVSPIRRPLRVCCREPGGQKIPIDCFTAGGAAVSSSCAAARRAAAYAGSGTLSAEHRLWCTWVNDTKSKEARSQRLVPAQVNADDDGDDGCCQEEEQQQA